MSNLERKIEEVSKRLDRVDSTLLHISQLLSGLPHNIKYDVVYAVKDAVSKKNDSSEYCTTSEACKMLSVSRMTLYRLRTEKGIKSRKINNRVYYSKADILALLENGNEVSFEEKTAPLTITAGRRRSNSLF
ncbi:helix-turn-helix domain-containing protein [Mongoliitalea daihaiensis]|uniref:helix-turn-helix domain-containing protein n=1 Tax=Mongoliitalea daihaiensis TaxID=2782006 RepID=UPI001F46DC18|nr:helix-turn-helix domain-containing protein [Mongoliitalea daihaiensis]UJP64055.1 helix-turn-helix domain-containing protein [Mongoliitalea daihaiensis]